MKKSISNSSSEYIEETNSDYEERVSKEKEMAQSLMIKDLQQRLNTLDRLYTLISAENIGLEFKLSSNKLREEVQQKEKERCVCDIKQLKEHISLLEQTIAQNTIGEKKIEEEKLKFSQLYFDEKRESKRLQLELNKLESENVIANV